MQAALDLAGLGIPVRLVERDAHLGGQVFRLDKVYPTDHCAFCPTWTHALACREHPLICVDCNTRFERLEEKGDGGITALLTRRAARITPEDCVFCGKCMAACPKKALLPRAPDLSWDPAAAPVPYWNKSACDGCGQCAAACPTGAVSMDSTEETACLPVSDCIFANGFEEPVPGPAPEFGAHSHPDILAAMAFEELHAECNALPGQPLRCPSDRRVARSIAFIQCAGARDKRHLEYCAAVCCMHAAKQASWMKKRQPELDVTVFYTDLRAPGKGQEAYMRAAGEKGVRFFRRRPGLVANLGGKGIAVRHEDSGTVGTTVVDLVVLNGGLASCPLAAEKDARAGLGPTRNGPTRNRLTRDRLCGFCAEPADIAHSVIQAGNAAALARIRQIRGRDGGMDGGRDDAAPTTIRESIGIRGISGGAS